MNYRLRASTEGRKNLVEVEFLDFADALSALAVYAKKYEWSFITATIYELYHDSEDGTIKPQLILNLDEENGVNLNG